MNSRGARFARVVTKYLWVTTKALNGEPLVSTLLADVPSEGPAATSRSHIDRLRMHLTTYRARLQPAVDAARLQYGELSTAVREHLQQVAPATQPTKAGLFLYLARPRSPLEWVRFPPALNVTLHKVAKARGIILPSRHVRVPRDARLRPSRAAGLEPRIYDWPWRYEDFRRRGVNAQPWEARLADDFERSVAGPLRRAVRAVPQLDTFLAELRPVEEIQLDIDAAEALVCDKLRLSRPDGPSLGESWSADLTAPRPLRTPDSHPMARLVLVTRLQVAFATRLHGCAAEYTMAAKLLRERLDPERQRVWLGPILAPRATAVSAPGTLPNPLLVWQAPKRGQRPDPTGYPSDAWRDLAWNSSPDAAKWRSYVRASSARGECPGSMSQFFWHTEAPRLLKDFEPAQPWERWFALYYDRNVITPLRRQWLLLRWIDELFRACVEPEDCRLQLQLERYLPNAL